MLLNDRLIIGKVKNGSLTIDPFDEKRVQPASYDVTLGTRFGLLTESLDYIRPWAKQPDLYRWIITREHILKPGKFCLATTVEEVAIPSDLAAQVGGKSSLGRLGLIIHATAGFIDPGFEGRITLELSNIGPRPIALRAGMPIAQLTFQQLIEPAEHPYSGKYQGQESTTGSRYYLNYSNSA